MTWMIDKNVKSESKKETPENQCDGCKAGIYKDVQGMHRDKDSHPIMVCQERMYK